MAVQGEGIVAREVRGAVAPEPLVIDAPGPGEVLVRVQASGVCHTDLHIRNGAIASFEAEQVIDDVQLVDVAV